MPADLTSIVAELVSEKSKSDPIGLAASSTAMPSLPALTECMDLLKAAIFPGFYGPSGITPVNRRHYVGAALDRAGRMLIEQIVRINSISHAPASLENGLNPTKVVAEFLGRIPEVRRLLATDVQAAYDGDPAARTYGEIIYCYPSLAALIHQRIAHVLFRQGVLLIPRIITEMAHAATGIDIHPGAAIGEGFFIDHGTGVVIGETSVIGSNVRLYQGVTLGAKSFPKDPSGRAIKGIARHPIVEDDVIVYAGATILGRVTIGRGAVIGGNVWVTEDVEPGEKVLQRR